MKKAKATDEKKEELFENWKNSSEHASIMRFVTARGAIKPILEDDTDLKMDIQPFLDELLLLSQELKIPGKKAKCKFGSDFFGLSDVFRWVEPLFSTPIHLIPLLKLPISTFITDFNFLPEIEQEYIRTMFFPPIDKQNPYRK